MNKYGYFSDDGLAFVVTNPATPRPFDNFLWNDTVFSCVHQTGVGYCDIQCEGLEAVKLYTGIGRVCDIETFGREHLMSRLIYVRDNETGAFWNVGWEPVCRDYDAYAGELGLGYTRITSCTEGIESSLLIFVPPGNDAVELWRLSVKNLSGRPRSLSLFAYNQYALMFKWGFESYGDMIYRGATYDEVRQAIVVEKHPYIRPHNYLTAFMVSDRRPDGFDGSQRCFLGPYGSLVRPQAVVNGACTNTAGSAESTVGVLQFNIALKPKQNEQIEIINGLTDSREHIGAITARYVGRMDEHFDSLHAEKRALIAHNRVATPDAHFNRMVNGWLKQQVLYGATWCRWGWMGYRDIVQQGGGVSSFDPERTRAILIEALQHQNADGLALRGWNPVDEKAYSDSALWLVFTLCWYLKETGDSALLDETIPFYDKGEASVLDHIETALRFLENNKGVHELCLIKFGDWNDSLTGIGKEGRGESVWLSMAYKHALDLMAELSRFLDDQTRTMDYERRAQVIGRAIHDQAWDGDWFTRCFDDNGRPIGSHENDQGKIFLNTQSWALIAGVADKIQRKRMLAACDQWLKTNSGYRLLAPPYLERDDHIGRISYLEPGICENGTIYTHGNAFLMLALLMEGDAERAYEVWRRITPGYIPDQTSPKNNCPPYVFANGYFGPEHRNNAFQMEYTWMTGSVAWLYNAILDYMIGIRREYTGLTIDPVLPAEWPEVTATRQFRGKHFEIVIRRDSNFSLTLNGAPFEGHFIPLSACQANNTIEIQIQSPPPSLG